MGIVGVNQQLNIFRSVDSFKLVASGDLLIEFAVIKFFGNQ